MTACTPSWWCNHWTWYCATLGGVFVSHIAHAVSVPVVSDEAYYRLWADFLQWGYYDHPPMIAWWIALGQGILPSPVGTRIVTVFSLILTSVILYFLLRQIGIDKSLARRGSLVWQFGGMVISHGFVALPDSPAILFWTATMLCAVCAVRANALVWWLIAGAFAGLTCLSKYSGFLLVPGIGLWLLVRHRDQFAMPGPYLGFAVALLVLAPNVWWNATNEWVAFAGQFGRIAQANDLALPSRPFTFLVGQILAFNPILVLMLIVACVLMIRQRDTFAHFDASVLFLVSAPLFAVIVIQSTRSIVLVHWTYPILPSLAALASLGLGHARNRQRALFWFCLVVAAAFFVIDEYRWSFSASFAQRRVESGKSVHGWPRFARDISDMTSSTGAAWIGTTDYSSASVLSKMDSLRQLPVVQLIERRRYPSGHLSWQAETTRPGLVLLSRYGAESLVDPADLQLCFNSVWHHGSIVRSDHGHVIELYDTYLVARPLGDILRQGCSLPSYRPFLGGARYLHNHN